MERRGPDPESLNTYEFSVPLVDVRLPDERDVEPLYELLTGTGRETRRGAPTSATGWASLIGARGS